MWLSCMSNARSNTKATCSSKTCIPAVLRNYRRQLTARWTDSAQRTLLAPRPGVQRESSAHGKGNLPRDQAAQSRGNAYKGVKRNTPPAISLSITILAF